MTDARLDRASVTTLTQPDGDVRLDRISATWLAQPDADARLDRIAVTLIVEATPGGFGSGGGVVRGWMVVPIA